MPRISGFTTKNKNWKDQIIEKAGGVTLPLSASDLQTEKDPFEGHVVKFKDGKPHKHKPLEVKEKRPKRVMSEAEKEERQSALKKKRFREAARLRQ